TGVAPGPGGVALDLGPSVPVGAFLVLWLTLWTVGGVAAIANLLKLLWGEDRIEVASGRLTVTWARGPFRSGRAFERDAIRRIELAGRDDHLSLAMARERVVLSGLGSRSERIAGAGVLRAALGVSEDPPAATAGVPPPWEEIITPEGERALVLSPATRRQQARAAGVGTLLLAASTFTLAWESVRQPGLI